MAISRTPKQPPLIYQQLVEEMGFDPGTVVSLPKRRARKEKRT